MWLLLPFWFFCHLAPVLSESSCQHETQTKYALPNRMIFGKISNLDPTPYPTPQHHHHQTVKVRGLPPDVQWTALRINNMVFLQNDLHNWKSIPQVQRHDQRIVWLWLRTEPARLLDKVKVHCSWQRNDGEKGGEALPIISLRPNWKCQSKQYSPARLVIKCNLMPWYGCDAPPTSIATPDGSRWTLELLVPIKLWTLLPAMQVSSDDDDEIIMLIICNRSTGGTTNGESSAEGSCVVVQLENRQTFNVETNWIYKQR